MRYELIGNKVSYVGKTLWEILGNLKNFGEGRLIKDDLFFKFEEPCFYKILKVVPKEKPKEQFKNRQVVVWVEEVYRGLKNPPSVLDSHQTSLTKFQLIPKCEEQELYKRAEEIQKTFQPTAIPKYSYCPPLYKTIWEITQQNKNKVYKSMPKFNVVLEESPVPREVATKDEEHPKLQCNLYKKDKPVAEKIKEIVHYKKLLKSRESRKSEAEN